MPPENRCSYATSLVVKSRLHLFQRFEACGAVHVYHLYIYIYIHIWRIERAGRVRSAAQNPVRPPLALNGVRMSGCAPPCRLFRSACSFWSHVGRRKVPYRSWCSPLLAAAAVYLSTALVRSTSTHPVSFMANVVLRKCRFAVRYVFYVADRL